jgi:hypothetical protein
MKGVDMEPDLYIIDEIDEDDEYVNCDTCRGKIHLYNDVCYVWNVDGLGRSTYACEACDKVARGALALAERGIL